jgi:hypothetical protein
LLHFTWLSLEMLVLGSALGLALVELTFGQGGAYPKRAQAVSDTRLLSWSSPTDRSAIIIFIMAVAVVTAISFRLGGVIPVKPLSDYTFELQSIPKAVIGLRTHDRFVHWGFIKKLIESSHIRNQWASLNYSYNIWHLFIALVSKFAAVSYRWVWSYAVLICVPLSVSAVFSLGKVLFKSEGSGLVCAGAPTRPAPLMCISSQTG